MNSGSTRPLWYRSLYWRIALGLFAFLALMLTAQGALFLWMTDRIAGSMPARSPRRLAALVASDISAAMNANPGLDLQTYLPEQYGETLQTFVVVMRDGRTFSNHDDVPEALLEAVREEQRFMADGRRRFGRRGGPGPLPEVDARDDNDAGPPPRRPPLARRGEFALVLVNGMPIGRVIVLPGGRAALVAYKSQRDPSLAARLKGVQVVKYRLLRLLVDLPALTLQAFEDQVAGDPLERPRSQMMMF